MGSLKKTKFTNIHQKYWCELSKLLNWKLTSGIRLFWLFFFQEYFLWVVAVCNSNFHNKLIQITINCTLYITQIKLAHILYSYYSNFSDKVIPTIHLYSQSNIVTKDFPFLTRLSSSSSYQGSKWEVFVRRIIQSETIFWNVQNLFYCLSSFSLVDLVWVNYNKTVKFSQLNDPLSLHKTNLRGDGQRPADTSWPTWGEWGKFFTQLSKTFHSSCYLY